MVFKAIAKLMKSVLQKHITNVRALQLFQMMRVGVLLLISIILTKSSISLNEIGLYETFLLIAGAVSFFWVNSMLQTLLSTYNANDLFNSNEKNPVLFNVFFLFTILGVLAALAIYFFQPFVAKLFSDVHAAEIPFMNILLVYVVLSQPANMVEYIYLLKNRALSLVFYGVLVSILHLVCFVVPALVFGDIEYGLYGLIAVSSIRILWLIVLLLRYSQIKLSWQFLKKYVYLTMPLAASMLLSGSAKYIDGFIISYYFDEAKFVIFRYGARDLPLITSLLLAFCATFIPRLSDSSNRNQVLSELKSGTTRMMHYLYPIAILALLFSKYLFPLIFNEYFVESALIFNIHILIIATNFVFAQTILVGLNSTKPIFYVSLVELILNVVLSLVLVQYYGIVGVAAATAISYFSGKIALSLVVRYKYQIKLVDYLNVKVYLIYTALMFACFAYSLSM